MRSADSRRFALPFRVAGCELLDFEKLVFIDIGECLTRVAGRPPDFKLCDPGSFAQANMLFEWRSTKRATTAYSAIDGARCFALVLHADFDPRSYRGTITLDPDELHVDPVVSVARILKKPEGMS